MSYSLVDLFCGAGGLSLGLHQAGFDTVFALDNEALACRTYAANISDKVVCGNIESYPADEILRITGLTKGEVTLVCGGPPCQGFSLQRRGEARDERNDLVHRFFEVAIALEPLVIMIENVPTILGARGRQHIEDSRQALEAAGYLTAARVLDAADFGVPQHRLRAFFIAWRADRVAAFEFPTPTHNESSWESVRSAIGNLPEPPQDCSEHPEYPNHKRVKISPLNELRISHVPEGGGRKDIPPDLQLPCHRNDNGHRHLDVYGRMSWSRPSPTITAMFDNFTRGCFAHPSSNRSITGREGARLQSFPDHFRFIGGKKDVARQIGNAVPPRLAKHLGEAVVAAIEGRVKAVRKTKQPTLFAL